MSRNNVSIYKGKVGSDRNSLEIRRLLLAEMAARATKNMLRQLLRTSAAQSHTTAHQTQVLYLIRPGHFTAINSFLCSANILISRVLSTTTERPVHFFRAL